MEFKKAMRIMRRICNKEEVNCEHCPLFLNHKCSVRPWVDSNVEQVEGILDKWDKTHQEPVYPTWIEWLVDVGALGKDYWGVKDLDVPIPADIAEKLGIEPKEANDNA